MKGGIEYAVAVTLASSIVFADASPIAAQDAAPSDSIEHINPLATIDLPSLKAFIERPLFSPARRVPAAVETEASPDETATEAPAETLNVRLLGVVVTPSNAVAHIENIDDATTSVLKVGDTIHAWTIKSIDTTGLVMEKDDEVRYFTLFKSGEP